MATYFEIIESSETLSNGDLARRFNPDAMFSEANGGAAARSCGHNMKVRAEKMIADGKGDEEYHPIRQRNSNSNGEIVTKPAGKGKGKAIMASSIESVPLRTLICQAITVAAMTYHGDLAMDTTQASICAHLEAQTPCLINALTVMAPLMGLDPDDAIVRLSSWSGVKTEEEKRAERCRSLANRIMAAHTAAKLREQSVENLIRAGFEVNAPVSHELALKVDATAVELAVKHTDEDSLEVIASGIL